ncbi:restriction endonuclease subunit S [Metamycoplasma hyosynoviae]|uniref:restriction endonuclease subunit S n=1 Tax=Metamycoplasma hyosynoviae TaxID=29559 RepID=UPI002359D444|nr:restriction endonuclease subunit S [Metamycoplasma hyosynoviae]MDC8918640.1 restriction endonuclease subunit S [Metamycoplasma hyosynoviae]
MPENKTKPEIRFKGFTYAWELSALGDLGTTFTGLSGKKKDDFGKGDAHFIPYLNVFNNPIIDPSFVESIEIDNSQNEVKYGDIFFTTSSETPDEVGMSSVWLSGLKNIYLNSFCFGYRLNFLENYDLNYLAYNFRSNSFRNHMILLAQGISRFNISKTRAMDIKISIPTLKEQQKIGNFFKNLDKIIDLHQRKCEKLQTIKKSLLSKMFPSDDKSIPEIRFNGYTYAWEHLKTKELCTISTGKSNTQDCVDDGIYPFYVRSEIVERSNRYLFDEEAVLTVGDGGIGKVFHYVNGKYDLHQRVYRMFNFSKEITAKYFYYYFSTYFYDRAMAMTAKTSVDSVRYEMIADMDISFPKVQEQKFITKFFKNLDKIIDLHQCKCEKLQTIKKSLLGKMFC